MKNPFKKAPVLSEPTFEMKKSGQPDTVPQLDPLTGQETKLDQDIKRYQDLEGLSIKKLEIGYWFIKNRHNFVLAFEAALAIIGAFTWSWFFYAYGHYIFAGMKQDRQLAQELSMEQPGIYQAIREQAARPVIVNSVQPIKNSLGTYDFAVNVTNPNPKHSANLRYRLEQNSEEAASGESFVLPEESKYILVLGVEPKGNVADTRFAVTGENYTRITAHDFPDWESFKADHLAIDTANIKFTAAQFTSLSEKISLNELSFVAVNNTVYNYYRVPFQVLLMSQSRLVGVNRVVAEKLKSGESRLIEMSWPGRLDRVTETRVIPEIDIVRPDIYFKQEYQPMESGR